MRLKTPAASCLRPFARATMAMIGVAAVLGVVMSSTILASPATAASPIVGTSSFTDVACPTPTQCLAVGWNAANTGGAAAPIDPLTGAISSGQSAQSIPGTYGLYGVACTSSTQCLAVGYESAQGGVAVPINPVTGAISNGQGVQLTAGVGLDAVACPTSTQCLGVGVNSAGEGVAIALNPTTGTVSSDQSAQPVPGSGEFQSVACSSSSQCLGVATNSQNTQALAVPLNPTTGAISAGQSPQTISGNLNVSGVACASSTQCLAVGHSYLDGGGLAVPLNPATGAVSSGQSMRSIPGATGGLEGVACPSSVQCLAVTPSENFEQGLAVALNPTTGVISTGESTQVVPGTTYLEGVACSSSTLCLGVGVETDMGAAVPLDPATGSTPSIPTSGPVKSILGTWTLTSVACPSPSQCLAVGGSNNVGFQGADVPLDPATGAISDGQNVQVFSAPTDSNPTLLTGVACSSSTQCLAVGANGIGEAVAVPSTQRRAPSRADRAFRLFLRAPSTVWRARLRRSVSQWGVAYSRGELRPSVRSSPCRSIQQLVRSRVVRAFRRSRGQTDFSMSLARHRRNVSQLATALQTTGSPCRSTQPPEESQQAGASRQSLGVSPTEMWRARRRANAWRCYPFKVSQLLTSFHSMR